LTEDEAVIMTPSQARQAVWRGQGPAGIDRIDAPHLNDEQWHAHLGPGKGSIAINQDGTWRHLPAGTKAPVLNKKQRDFLRTAGWKV
jgi:hypothetical protein